MGAACLWEGTAPACNGKCEPGYQLIKKDKKGDGTKCVTGQKAYCCKEADIRIRGTAPACSGQCKAGETTLGYQKKGPNGHACITGKAAICLIATN